MVSVQLCNFCFTPLGSILDLAQACDREGGMEMHQNMLRTCNTPEQFDRLSMKHHFAQRIARGEDCT